MKYKNERLVFFNIWKDLCVKNQKFILENWKKRTKYTNFILNDEQAIIKKIARRIGLKVYREYYFIDALLYKDIDLVSNTKNSTWFKRIRIAFEHEHDSRKSYEELSHLLVTNCELGVLVTYPSYQEEKEQLNRFKEIVEGSLNKKDSLLVIFGFKDEEIEWKGYIIKNNNFVPL